jgi:hypothetical protein
VPVLVQVLVPVLVLVLVLVQVLPNLVLRGPNGFFFQLQGTICKDNLHTRPRVRASVHPRVRASARPCIRASARPRTSVAFRLPYV